MQHTKKNQKTTGRTARGLSALMLLTGITVAGAAMAQAVPNDPLQGVGRALDTVNGGFITGAIYAAHITNIVVDDPTNVYSSGIITLDGGHQIIIPANLVMDLPANRLTLANFCYGDQVPADEALDPVNLCGVGHLASIIANRQGNGTVIAGDVTINKDDDSIQGTVTAINGDGSFVVNGTTTIRPNDPDAVHSVQSGANNGSPDVRYTNDPSNYTFTFTSGYPVCFNGPNCSPNSGRAGGATAAQAGDASRFEPLLVGDHLTAVGPVVKDPVTGAPLYQSAHTMMINAEISTSGAGPINHVLVEEAEWDINNFANARMRGLNIGVVSDLDAVAMYRIMLNGASDALGTTGCVADELIADTAACDLVGGPGSCGGQGIAANGGQVVKQNYDWDFIIGESKADRNPVNVLNAVLPIADPAGLMVVGASDADNSLRIMAPIGRDIVYKSHKWLAAVAAFDGGAGTGADPSTMVQDASGNPAQWGQYLSPNGIGHPEWNEVDLAGFDTPFMFEGLNWNRDRRLGPEGGSEPLATNALYTLGLNPFPSSGLNGLAVIVNNGPGGRDGSVNGAVGTPANYASNILYQDACANAQKLDTDIPAPSQVARALVLDPTAPLVQVPLIVATGEGTPGISGTGTGNSVLSHALVNANGNTIGTINNGDTLNIAGLAVNIEAVASAGTATVLMSLPPVVLASAPNTDGSAPFTVIPDPNPRDNVLTTMVLNAGVYKVTSTPVSRRVIGISLTTTFTVQ